MKRILARPQPPVCECGHDEPTHRVIIDNHGTESGFCYACPDVCSEFRKAASSVQSVERR